MIAELSEGAMRDALSILERCVQNGETTISQEKIRELIGIPKLEYINKIAKAIIEYDIDLALQTIQSVIDDGKDINNLLWEIIKYIKDVLIAKTNGTLSLYDENELQEIKSLAEKTTKERLIKLIYDLSELENNMKWSTQKLIMFQAGIIKLCNKENEALGVSESKGMYYENTGIDISRLEERVTKIENYLRAGGGIRSTNNSTQAKSSSSIASSKTSSAQKSRVETERSKTKIFYRNTKILARDC